MPSRFHEGRKKQYDALSHLDAAAAHMVHMAFARVRLPKEIYTDQVVTLHPIYKPVCTTRKPLTQMVLALYEYLLHHVLLSSFISNRRLLIKQAHMCMYIIAVTHVYVHYSSHACVCTL